MKIKTIFLVFAMFFIFTAQNCFVVDVNELNVDFFGRFNDEN